MNSQPLIDSLLEDPFSAKRVVLSRLMEGISKFCERWTPETEKSIVQSAKDQGYTLITHEPIGENYELALWKGASEVLPGGEGFFVSLNFDQHDPLSAIVQRADVRGGGIPTWIKEWVDLYGPIIVGSGLASRTDAYYRILLHSIRPGYRFTRLGQDFLDGAFMIEKI